MIDSIIRYWKIGLVLGAMAGGLIGTYLLPSASALFAFLLDVKQVKAEQTFQRKEIDRLKEVVIISDTRYQNIETYMRRMDERDRQERLSKK